MMLKLLGQLMVQEKYYGTKQSIETFSYISNNRPYYTELQTKRASDQMISLRRLHDAILTKFSRELERILFARVVQYCYGRIVGRTIG